MTDYSSKHHNNPNEGITTTTTTTTSGGSHSILSEKVTRALQVRTDTVAMKAALEALAALESNSTNDTSSNTTIVDSRNVRTAIEYDALQQAIQLQNALSQIVQSVKTLREGCTQLSKTAVKVREAVNMSVIPSQSTSTTTNTPETASMLAPSSVPTTAAETSTTNTTSSNNEDTTNLVAEQKLATVLADAFAHRDMARKRLDAVHNFLEKFNLSSDDSELLTNYNFDDANIALAGEAVTTDATAADIHHTYETGFAFLHALERVRKIRLALHQTFDSDASSSFKDSSNNDDGGLGASSALRMMESLSQKQELAYERLYHWLQQHLHLFPDQNDSTTTNIDYDETYETIYQNQFVLAAVYTLRHVPAFYTHTIELIASTRRSEVTRRFLLALTSGYNDLPPMEMKAHDSVAYVGDMLAFAFKCFSVEADLSKGLLQYHPDFDDDENEEDKVKNQDQKNETKEEDIDDLDQHPISEEYSPETITAETMLSVSMSGLARPLKSRIMQVIASLARHEEDDADDDSDEDDDFEEEGSVVRNKLTNLYEICGLLLFYSSTMEKGVQKLRSGENNPDDNNNNNITTNDKGNPLVTSLVECLTEGTKAYEATIRVYASMLDQLSVMTGDSEAALTQQMLVKVAHVHTHSPGFSKDVDCPESCQRILSLEWVTETLIDYIMPTHCTSLDDVVSLKQSLTAVKAAGMSITAAEKLDERVDTQENELLNTLVATETAQVLELCGLSTIAAAWMKWNNNNKDIQMSKFPGLTMNEIENGMKEFHTSLYSPPLPSLEAKIKNVDARKMARCKIANEVCTIYTNLYNSITNQNSGYNNFDFLSHTPDQVKTLFSA